MTNQSKIVAANDGPTYPDMFQLRLFFVTGLHISALHDNITGLSAENSLFNLTRPNHMVTSHVNIPNFGVEEIAEY